MQPIPSKYFEDNRKRFGASTDSVPLSFIKCDHELIRKGNNVECSKCHMGWTFKTKVPEKLFDKPISTS